MSHNTPQKQKRSLWGQSSSYVRLAMLVVVAVITATISLTTFAQQPAAKLVEDLPAGAMQAKATTSCLECHEARIILQQRLSKGAWTKEVDKMVKWGAVVDATDHDALIDYLSTNFSPDQPPYEAPRTAIEKTSAESKKKNSR
jgi:mono/diheme cytochrome c family protein